jgi:hypothetical protein
VLAARVRRAYYSGMLLAGVCMAICVLSFIVGGYLAGR